VISSRSGPGLAMAPPSPRSNSGPVPKIDRMPTASKMGPAEEVTFSLPSSCNKVDAGHWSRLSAYDALLRSVQGNAIAALPSSVDS
jgi:hypothetical protein